MNQYYYRNLKDNSKIIRVFENEVPDCNEWEQISDREATQSARIAELEAALKTAVRYLEHPEVKAIPFALPAESVVEHIQNLLKSNSLEQRSA